MTSAHHEVGVFYQPRDYLGVGRRLAIDLLDTVLATGVSLLVSFALLLVWRDDETTGLLLLALWATIWFWYFVILKRSRYGTVGYWLFGARVVNLHGERPSIGSLLIRLLFVVGGPANFLVDLLWISADPYKQAIRDKFAHTYVIRRDAQPSGTGAVVYRTYTMLGTTFYFQEVKEATPAAV